MAKYYAEPSKFNVGDGKIVIGSYYLRADTNHPDFVVVFLGDLGRDIPFSEQKYWKSYNILPEGKMSNTAFRRSFLGEFADPEAEQFIFKQKYNALRRKWSETFGWDLLRPLADEDGYRIATLRIPISENQQEFDQLAEHLCVIIVESINDQDIFRELTKADLSEQLKGARSIRKLGLFCEHLGLEGFEPHIEFLKSLYWLRTKGSSHRKSTKEYIEVRTAFKLDEMGYVEVFRSLLKGAIKFLDYFHSVAETGKYA